MASPVTDFNRLCKMYIPDHMLFNCSDAQVIVDWTHIPDLSTDTARTKQMRTLIWDASAQREVKTPDATTRPVSLHRELANMPIVQFWDGKRS